VAENATFFVYTDANGVDVVVSRMTDVPPGYRAQARSIDLSQPAVKAPRAEAVPVATVPPAARTAPVTPFHKPSFVAGAGAGLALGIALVLAFHRTTRRLALIMGGLLASGLMLGYLSFVRRQAGLPAVDVTTPAVLLDDAHRAAEAMKRREAAVDNSIEAAHK
jgi:hypothetical protein